MGKVLFVDDDENLLAGLRRQLRKRYDLDCATGGHAALEMMSRSDPYAVVVSDMRMPEMDGVEFLSMIAKKHPNPIRIMLTGNADQQTAIDAVNRGHIFGFLNKPCDPETLSQTLDKALEQHRLKTMERDLLERTLAGSVKVLLDVMRVINPIAFGRAAALQKPAVAIAEALGCQNLWEVKIATLLSAIGWISVPEHIVAKVAHGRSLAPDEQEVVDNHAEIAFDLLKNVPRLEEIAQIIRLQDKNFDGSGAPRGASVSHEELPLGSRILKVLNAITPLDRPRPPTSAALEVLDLTSGQFDPAVILVAKDLLEDPDNYTTGRGRAFLEITPNRLLAGDRLEVDLRSPDGSLLLSAGNEVSEFHIAKLRNHPKFKAITEAITVSREFVQP